MYVNDVKLIFKSKDVCEKLEKELSNWNKGYRKFVVFRFLYFAVVFIATVASTFYFYRSTVEAYGHPLTAKGFTGDVVLPAFFVAVMCSIVAFILSHLTYELYCDNFINKYVRTSEFSKHTIKKMYNYFVKCYSKYNYDMLLSGMSDVEIIIPTWTFINSYKQRCAKTSVVYISKNEKEVNGWVLKVLNKETGSVETVHKVDMLADESSKSEDLVLVVTSDSMAVYDKSKEVVNVY